MKVNNVFHVSLLDRYIGPVPGQQPSDPPPAITAENPDDEEWEVERILNSRKRYRKLWYLVQWAGHNYVNRSWEPAENLESASEVVADFHRENPAKPRALVSGGSWSCTRQSRYKEASAQVFSHWVSCALRALVRISRVTRGKESHDVLLGVAGIYRSLRAPGGSRLERGIM
jgi:hypothetical protein